MKYVSTEMDSLLHVYKYKIPDGDIDHYISGVTYGLDASDQALDYLIGFVTTVNPENRINAFQISENTTIINNAASSSSGTIA